MPTVHDQKPMLAQLKRELETGGEMTEQSVGTHIAVGAQIDSQGFSWIEVMPTAEGARNGDWYFTVTSGDLGVLADYIQANPDRIPIDYDHSGAMDSGSTRAAGWFTGEATVVEAGGRTPDGEVQDHESVWAQVKWTPTAVEEIRGGAFRFISPEWHFGEKDPKTGLMTKLKDLAAATLTNRPFFKDLAPVTAKAEPEQIEAITAEHGEDIAELVLAGLEVEDERTTKAAEQVLAALSMSEEGGDPSATDQGTDDDLQEATVADESRETNEALVTDYMKMLGLDATVDPKQRLAVAFREKDEKILALEQERTELNAKLQEADKLNERVAELEARDRQRDIEVILARAVEKGRVFPAEKDKLAEIFAKDVNGLRQLIATRPTEMFATLAPKGVAGDSRRFEDDPEVARYVKSLGADDPVDTEQAKQHLAAMELLKEQGKADNYTNDEYVAAYEQASDLVY